MLKVVVQFFIVSSAVVESIDEASTLRFVFVKLIELVDVIELSFFISTVVLRTSVESPETLVLFPVKVTLPYFSVPVALPFIESGPEREVLLRTSWLSFKVDLFVELI